MDGYVAYLNGYMAECADYVWKSVVFNVVLVWKSGEKCGKIADRGEK